MAQGRNRLEKRVRGLPLSGGCTVARVCMFNEDRHSNLPIYHVDGEGLKREQARADRAIEIAGKRLDEVRERVRSELGPAEAEIFVAQHMILNDPAVREKIHAVLRDGRFNAETAIARALDEYEARLLQLDSEYLRERATDIGEIKRRLLDVLRNMQPKLQCDEAHCQKGRNRIVVAEEMTPSLTVDLDTRHTMGFVTERGGVESHAAILARALGIPAVSGVKGLRDMVSCGMEILLNGTTGEVVLWPGEATVREARAVAHDHMRMPQVVGPVPGLCVMANVGFEADMDDAVAMQAEGVGLYRTEIDVMVAGRLEEEDALLERYRSACRKMGDAPVCFRVFDAGSDKPLPQTDTPREENPALGWRGARLLLGHAELFRPQARAFARLSREHEVHLLYPMIVDVAQFLAVKDLFASLTADLPAGRIRHGVMIEVPSACLQARDLLARADFGSIGTNDLTQYLFAVDRNNEHVSYDFRPDHPVMWELMASVARAAREAGKPLSVCGELAADPRLTGRLLGAGIDTVSVNPRSIPAVRAAAKLFLADAGTGPGAVKG
jgi:phosphotransferase system enzyme I (PtsI)